METMKEKEARLQEEKLESMRTAKHKFFLWVDSRTDELIREQGADANDLPGCMSFSIQTVLAAIDAHLRPLSLLSENAPFDRIITPCAVEALRIALDELDKAQDNAAKVLEETAANEANEDDDDQPTE